MCETRCDNVDMENVKEKMETLGMDVVFKNRYELSRFKSGGLMIAIKKNVDFEWKHIQNNYETLLSVKVFRRDLGMDKDLIITSVYIPPSQSRYASRDHFDEMDNLLLNYTNVDFFHVLCGDYNAHTGTTADILISNNDNVNNYVYDDNDLDLTALGVPITRYNMDITADRSSYGSKLIEVCKNNQVIIYNGRLGDDVGIGKATTTYNTTVDYIIGSPLLTPYIAQFRVLDFEPLYSDVHSGLMIQLNLTNNIPIASDTAVQIRTEGELSERPGRWSVDKKDEYVNNIDYHKVQQIIAQIDYLSVDQISQELKHILIETATKVFPWYKKRIYVKKSNGVSMKGFNSKTWTARKQYHKAKHKHNLNKTNINYLNMINKSKGYKKSLKQVKNNINKSFIAKLKENKIKDPKLYWKIIKDQKKQDKIPVGLDEFYDHFKMLAANDIGDNENFEYEINPDDATPILNDPITLEEITTCIDKLKNSKSPGNDMILNEYIKYTKDLLSPLYVKLFNKILDSGNFPSEWLIGVIVPLYKNKGDKTDVNNYRGVTLLSCIGKLFTSILNERLREYVNVNNIISEAQAGFRAEYSTLDHIFLLKCVIDLFLWKKEKLFCLFVDYKKAFDMVWREGLWYKLVKEKVDGKIMNVIRNMYSNIKSCVMLEQQKTDTFLCNMGVRQGENLSPLLFAFFVNDMETHFIEYGCNYLNFKDDTLNTYLQLLVIMYADDTVILSDSENGMKQALLALNEYTREWKLQVNCNKTKVVVFSRGKVQTDKYKFKLGEDDIEVVGHYKYLGITFNYNGRFRKGEMELKEQAQRAMYSIIGTSRKYDLPVDIQLEMFNSMILPIMTYASEIWGNYVIREMELLQIKYFKQVLCVHKRTSTDIVYGELGVYPIGVQIKCQMIGYWVRILSGKNTKLSYIMYKCLLQLHTSGVYSSPWITFIRSICNDCGMSGIWTSQSIVNPKWFKQAVKLRLKDQWITKWSNNLQNKSICSSYNLFKEIYVLEDYLLKLSKGNRITLCKLRACNNKFPINVGRYEDIPRENRICSKCVGNHVGDEYHILFNCQNANIVRLREMYVPSYYRVRPTQIKHKLLMQTSNVNTLNNLSLFLRAVFSMYR